MIYREVEMFKREHDLADCEGDVLLEAIIRDGWTCIPIANDGDQARYEMLVETIEDNERLLNGRHVSYQYMDIGPVWCFKEVK